MTGDERDRLIDEFLARWTVADFDYSDDQSDLFTSHHMKYGFTLKFDGRPVHSDTYQFNPDHWPKAIDILDCVIDDASSIAPYSGMNDEDSMFEWMEELGYLENAESAKAGRKVWKGCKKEYEDVMKAVKGFYDEKFRDDDDDDEDIASAEDLLRFVYDRMNDSEFDRSIVKFEEG